MEAAGLCAGVLVTIACTFSWVMLVVALPPVILLQRSLLHQQLRAAAQSDPKTGLLNAVAWQRDAERWIRRARRLSVPAAILLVDIDHFKRVNDTYGHLAGDELLAATASTLGQHVRACDVLGRFGGEEFVAVLPGAGQQEACHIAERLRGRVRDIAVQARGATVTVTVSIGVAALGVDGERPVRTARRGRRGPVPGQEVGPGPGVHASPGRRAVRPAALMPLTLEHAGIYLSDACRPLGEGRQGPP